MHVKRLGETGMFQEPWVVRGENEICREEWFSDQVRSFALRIQTRIASRFTDLEMATCPMIYPTEIESVPDVPVASTTEPVWACIRTHPKHEHIAAAQLS